MAKYETKPMVVEAVQWDGKNIEECEEFVGEELDVLSGVIFLDGRVFANKGHYIVKDINGDLETSYPDEFERTHVKMEGK